MPLYEYRCSACNHKFEKLRPISEANKEIACPKCNRTSQRILSTFASFSKSADGATTAIAGAGSSCAGCTSTNCSSCH